MAVANIYKSSLCRRLFINISLIENNGFKYSNRIYTIRRLKFSSYNNGVNFRRSNLSLIAAGLGAGALVGGGYSWYRSNQIHKPIANENLTERPPILKKIPDFKISRKIVSPTDNTGLKLVLFQYPTCPFCCKVRAFLDYNSFSYDVIEVDPVLRQQTKWSKYKKVPILLAQVENGYQQLNDSSLIISMLQSFLHDREANNLSALVKFYPVIKYNDDSGNEKTDIMNKYFLMYQGDVPKGSTPETTISERKWRKWADDVLVHVLSPNVYRTREEALQAFTWFSEVGEWDRLFPSWERNLIIYAGALAMWGIGKRLKKKYGLKEDVRQSLYDDCNIWLREVSQKKGTFHGGSKPDLADLAVFGVLSSIEGCTAFQDLLNHSNIGTWFNNMKREIANHKGNVISVP